MKGKSVLPNVTNPMLFPHLKNVFTYVAHNIMHIFKQVTFHHWGTWGREGGREGGRKGRREGGKEGGREGGRGTEHLPQFFPTPENCSPPKYEWYEEKGTMSRTKLSKLDFLRIKSLKKSMEYFGNPTFLKLIIRGWDVLC